MRAAVLAAAERYERRSREWRDRELPGTSWHDWANLHVAIAELFVTVARAASPTQKQGTEK